MDVENRTISDLTVYQKIHTKLCEEKEEKYKNICICLESIRELILEKNGSDCETMQNCEAALFSGIKFF